MGSAIAIGLVIYGPSESLLARLQSDEMRRFDFYIYDNWPEHGNSAPLRTCSNVKYFTCGSNAGLGIGISTLCAQAFYDGFKAMLFFDQDTGFSGETLRFVEDYYATEGAALARYSAVVFNARGMKGAERVLKPVKLAINSGSLYLLANVKLVRWHDHGYFVDGVDYKFCLDSARAGLKIGECGWTPGFDHVTEQADRTYRLFGREFRMRAYPLFRMKDTFFSSVKLIGAALIAMQWHFAAKITRLFIIYTLSQVFVRTINLVPGKRNE